VARAPTTPAAPAAEVAEAVTAESLGWQLRSALPPMRLHSVSLYSNEADVLWLSEGALGPDEHNVIVEAIEYLRTEKGVLYHELGMEDGRIALFLGIRGPRGDLVGTVMILADMKSMSEGTMERVLTVPVKTLMQKMAVFLRKMYPQADTSQTGALPIPAIAEAKPAAVAPTAATTSLKNPAPTSDTLAPKQVEAILTLELLDEPAPVIEKAAAQKAPPLADKPRGAPAVVAPASAAPKIVPKAVPMKAVPLKGGANQAANARASSPASAKAPTGGGPRASATPAPAAPLPEIEVLAFDSNISIPSGPARAPSAPPADVDVLPFDANIQIPTAHPAPSQAAFDAADIEVLDFTSELKMPPMPAPQMASPAPPTKIVPPVAKAATAPVPIDLDLPIAKPAPIAVEPPVARAAPAPISVAPPVAKAPATKASVAETVSAPLLSNTSNTTTTARAHSATAEVALLINDTGPMKRLEVSEDTTSIEAVLPSQPPPAPLSVAETATDLTLFVQELIKLRSSGRTKRYEVLARSRRDAGRNEVPTAFVAETTRGEEGAALDALVIEHLLKWLGEHGETIWDSEPASFSVNLSIGALEDETFPDKIAKWLEQYNVPAEYVGFEISEFACVQCRLAVQRFVDACEKIGCFLVIDNFSFDSNMFEFLGSKALRHVKIDPKLTSAAMKEKLPQALVVAILQACKVLGVHCVAKRIESKSSLQWLTAVGCDFVQSFQLEKPAALDTLVAGKAIKALRE
jgi:EAL domain-containing protein (putative c-di-GMP-specific phosphodiesterase class I)